MHPIILTKEIVFFKSISENISELATGAIILGGDFNEILDTKLDRRNPRILSLKEQRLVTHWET